MELKKRGKVWHVDLRDAEGRRVRRSTLRESKAEAMKVARRLQEEVWEAKGVGATDKRSITVAAALDLYVERLGERSSAGEVKTLRAKLVGDPVRFPGRWCVGEDYRLHEVTPATLEELIRARTKEGNGPQTIAHEIKMLRATNFYLADLGYRVAEVTKWRIPELPQKTRYLSPEEFGRLLAYFDPAKAGKWYAKDWQDIHDMLIALGTTGARWGEIAGLTWDQVGAPAFDRLVIWGNKTGRERLGTLTGALQGVLERRWASPGRVGPLVFPNRSGGLRSGPCRPIADAMVKLGFNDPITASRHGRASVHTIRHSFASWVRQSGAGLDEVGKLLGHASPQSTMRYAHLEAQEVVRKAAGVIDGIIPSATRLSAANPTHSRTALALSPEAHTRAAIRAPRRNRANEKGRKVSMEGSYGAQNGHKKAVAGWGNSRKSLK